MWNAVGKSSCYVENEPEKNNYPSLSLPFPNSCPAFFEWKVNKLSAGKGTSSLLPFSSSFFLSISFLHPPWDTKDLRFKFGIQTPIPAYFRLLSFFSPPVSLTFNIPTTTTSLYGMCHCLLLNFEFHRSKQCETKNKLSLSCLDLGRQLKHWHLSQYTTFRIRSRVDCIYGRIYWSEGNK